MSKTCLECGDKIVGREDKKFCSDACRNAYNNKMNKDQNNLMRNINNKLRKNYRILCDLNPENKTKTTRTKLLAKGFDFEFITSIYETKNGNIYYFLYDQGYMAIENDSYVLVKKDS
jgi:predicted nucleic acid-binding Zn ribbon protein